MRRDPLGSVLLALVCVAAVVASFSTLASLAAVAGWGERASWLLPVCLDALGMVACRSWLSTRDPAPARRFAKLIVLWTVILSVVGNAAGHLAGTGHLSQGIILVILVGAVPPAGLAVGMHLAVLRNAVPDAAPVPAAKLEKLADTQDRKSKPPPKKTATPKPSPKPAPVESGVKSGLDSGEVDAVTLQRARHLDEKHQQEHGRPIGRDALKIALECGTTKATAVAAALKKEREVA